MMADITLNKAETKIVLTALGYALGVCESEAEQRGENDVSYTYKAARASELLSRASLLIVGKIVEAESPR